MVVNEFTERQQAQIEAERAMAVYKRNDMIQQARFNLSVQEQRTVLYAISKIQPEDTYLKAYEFDIKDFYKVIGWTNQSYTEFKAMLKTLSDKSWWATIKREDGTEFESLVRWFTTARSDKRSGKVTVKFHEDMMPYLLQLAEQDAFYTSYNLRYVLPMSSQYAPRLYELLKSYGNNRQWFFEIDELKRLLDCQSYARFPDFRRFVLEPAIQEVNKYTDICCTYKPIKEGRKVVRIYFYFDQKTDKELHETKYTISKELDGVRQMDMYELFSYMDNDPETQFKNERRAIREAEKAEKERRQDLLGGFKAYLEADE